MGPTPVTIFQVETEFDSLLDLYRAHKPLSVLEVGTYHGGTLYHFLRNAPKGATVVSVDSYMVGVDNRHLYESWCPEGVQVVAIQGESAGTDTAAEAAKWGDFEFVFIDAGHYYQEVKADWETYRPMVMPGGIVAFHDIAPDTVKQPEIEVPRLWAEIKDGHRNWEIVDPDSTWGGIGVLWM